MKTLDEKSFIRHRLFYSGRSPLATYAGMVCGKKSWAYWLRYEILTSLLGPLPGAVGYGMRKLLYPALFQSVGRNVIFGRNITLRHPDKIRIGDNVVIDDYALLDGRGASEEALSIGDNVIIGRQAIIQSKVGPITIGDNCNIGTLTVIVAQGGVEIGEWTQIAGGCKISGGLFKPDPGADTPFPFSRFSKGPITIGAGCFLGGSVQVVDGVTIGAGSMIGTGSVIMANVPENAIFVPRQGLVVGKTDQSG